jgi:hypothetical protein
MSQVAGKTLGESPEERRMRRRCTADVLRNAWRCWLKTNR